MEPHDDCVKMEVNEEPLEEQVCYVFRSSSPQQTPKMGSFRECAEDVFHCDTTEVKEEEVCVKDEPLENQDILSINTTTFYPELSSRPRSTRECAEDVVFHCDVTEVKEEDLWVKDEPLENQGVLSISTTTICPELSSRPRSTSVKKKVSATESDPPPTAQFSAKQELLTDMLQLEVKRDIRKLPEIVGLEINGIDSSQHNVPICGSAASSCLEVPGVDSPQHSVPVCGSAASFCLEVPGVDNSQHSVPICGSAASSSLEVPAVDGSQHDVPICGSAAFSCLEVPDVDSGQHDVPIYSSAPSSKAAILPSLTYPSSPEPTATPSSPAVPASVCGVPERTSEDTTTCSVGVTRVSQCAVTRAIRAGPRVTRGRFAQEYKVYRWKQDLYYDLLIQQKKEEHAEQMRVYRAQLEVCDLKKEVCEFEKRVIEEAFEIIQETCTHLMNKASEWEGNKKRK